MAEAYKTGRYTGDTAGNTDSSFVTGWGPGTSNDTLPASSGGVGAGSLSDATKMRAPGVEGLHSLSLDPKAGWKAMQGQQQFTPAASPNPTLDSYKGLSSMAGWRNLYGNDTAMTAQDTQQQDDNAKLLRFLLRLLSSGKY